MARNAQPDLSEFEAFQGTSGRPILMDRIIAALPDDQRVKLDAALRSQSIGPDAIAATLGKWGHKISGSAVHYYRKANGWR